MLKRTREALGLWRPHSLGIKRWSACPLVAALHVDWRMAALDQCRSVIACIVAIISVDPRGRGLVDRNGRQAQFDRTQRWTSDLAPGSVRFLRAADPLFCRVCGWAAAIGCSSGPFVEFSAYVVRDHGAVVATTGGRTAKFLMPGRPVHFSFASQTAFCVECSITSSATECRSRVLDRLR